MLEIHQPETDGRSDRLDAQDGQQEHPIVPATIRARGVRDDGLDRIERLRRHSIMKAPTLAWIAQLALE